jgi:hypothetical protein
MKNRHTGEGRCPEKKRKYWTALQGKRINTNYEINYFLLSLVLHKYDGGNKKQK